MDLLNDIARDNADVVTRRAARAAGIGDHVLRDRMRLGSIARIARGVYVAAATPGHASPAVITRQWRVVLSYESAAAWWGIDLPVPVPVMHVTAPRNRGRRTAAVVDGVRLHRATLNSGEFSRLRGVLVTTPLRTVLDIARTASLDQAVAIADSFIRAGLLSIDELVGAAHAMPAAPRRCRVQLAVSLVDPLSGSVLESLTRVLLWRNGVCPPTSQWEVRNRRGALVGRFDFAWTELALILECDGFSFHSGREEFRRDRRRWAALTRLGWRVAVVTWYDVVEDPGYVVDLVRDLVESGAQL